MTRFWKTVLLITLIVPLMLLVVAAGWYARAQAPKNVDAANQEFLDLLPPEPVGGKLVPADIRSNVGDSRLEELRTKAVLAEKRSIERANGIRERLKQSEGGGDGEVKKALRTELRVAVLEAFKARHDLHAAEVASLEMQAQAMKRKLAEREASSSDIVDRRVEELLNPDKQWNAESPIANVPRSETISVEPSPGDENKLLVRRSETSVKVEGQFDGNEEILLVIGDPRFTAIANTAQELKDVKELKWTSSVDKAGEYVIEVRRDVVTIGGGGTAPGLVFQVHNLPNTVQSTSNITFTDKDPLPNGKVVIASPKTKLLLKRKTDQVLVTVGHVELPDALNVVPINIVIRRRAAANTVEVFEQPAVATISGKQLGTVLGKPIHESDLNKNVSTGDNLKRLLLQPLMENYCRKHKLDRAEELQTKIKDEKRRAMARLFVLPTELHRHLFEKHGGRVILSPFGPVAFDGLKKWLEEREQAGDFEITDPELKAKYRELWIQEPAGARFAPPDQIKAAFDPALTDRFIDNLAKKVEPAKKTSRVFPVELIKGHIASIKQRTTVAEAVVELRKITGLDFGDGVDRVSRQAWLEWWDQETSCIHNAKDGVREFIVTGIITANGKPVSGANVQAHVPSKSSFSGQYQLAETLSDSSGRYVLALGLPPFATPEEATWNVSFTVRNPPRFVADQEPVVMTLHRNKAEDTDTALGEAALEQLGEAALRKKDAAIFPSDPVERNFKLRLAAKPLGSADTDTSPKTEPPVRAKPQDKLPDSPAAARQ